MCVCPLSPLSQPAAVNGGRRYPVMTSEWPEIAGPVLMRQVTLNAVPCLAR